MLPSVCSLLNSYLNIIKVLTFNTQRLLGRFIVIAAMLFHQRPKK